MEIAVVIGGVVGAIIAYLVEWVIIDYLCHRHENKKRGEAYVAVIEDHPELEKPRFSSTDSRG